MSETAGIPSGRSQADTPRPALSAAPRAPARCVHSPDGAVVPAGSCGCGLTWCDTPWSSSRMGCPWYNVSAAT